MLHKYRKIATVEAEQFSGTAKQIKKYGIMDKETLSSAPYQGSRYFIPTLEGNMAINKIGDYIVTGVNNEHWCVDKDIFEKTYERMD